MDDEDHNDDENGDDNLDNAAVAYWIKSIFRPNLPALPDPSHCLLITLYHELYCVVLIYLLLKKH